MAEATGVATFGDTDTITTPATAMETLASGWQVPAWRKLSACRNVDSAVLFPDNGRPRTEATAACSECPVRSQCLESALESPWMPYGPWGGLSQKDVQAMWLQRHPRDRADDDGVLAYLGLI